MENFYYACLYGILRQPTPHTEKRSQLNHLKAKIVKLHTTRLEQGQVELRSPDIFQEERMSLFQLIKRREKRGKREIARVQEREHGWQTSARDIIRVFSEHMREKYSPIQEDEDCVRRMLETDHGSLPLEGQNMMEIPITTEDLKAVVYKGNINKSPGRDGIALEFYTVLWDQIAGEMGALFNQILHDRQLTERQKQGVVCIPKQASPKIPEDYRPLTLLNTDYKILARLIAARVRPFLSELLHPSQHCGIPSNTIHNFRRGDHGTGCHSLRGDNADPSMCRLPGFQTGV